MINHMTEQMRPLVEHLSALGFGTELIYSFVIIACSLLIYFGVKELYELSSYKGIKYFRQAFLFFAIAYFFRSFIRFIVIIFNIKEIFEFPVQIVGFFTLFLFMYFSSMAIFYLIYSIMWKKWNGNNKIWIFRGIAFLISLLTIISRSREVHLALSLMLLVFIALIVYMAYHRSIKKKKNYNLYFIYMLLSVFWVLNIIDILIPPMMEVFRLLIYITSLGIFLTVFYKVLKKTGSD